MRRLLLVITIFLVSLSTFGANMSTIAPLSSEVYENLETLYLLQGLAPPSQAKPWSQAEIESMIGDFTENNLSGLRKSLFKLIKQELEKNKRAVTVGISLSPEMYAHTNGDEFYLDTDWIYGYDKRKPFATLLLELRIGDFFYSYGELAYGYGRVTMQDSLSKIDDLPEIWLGVGALVPQEYGDKPVITLAQSAIYRRSFLFNLPPVDMIDLDTPRRALVAVGGKDWVASLSRDKIEWGNSHIGNFIFDSHVDYQEYLRFKFFKGRITFDTVFMFMDTNYNSLYSSTFTGPSQLFLTHRLEIRPWQIFSFAISENVIYRYDTFEARYLNPAYIYHNLNNSDLFNAIAHIEMNLTPLPGLQLYGQSVLDQARAPTESDSEASAWGFSAGLTYKRSLQKGILSSTAEFAYTTPLLYRRDKVDFLMFHKYSINRHVNYPFHKILVFDYIGFPYGGDSQVFLFEAGYRIPSVLTIQVKSLFIRQGEMNFYISHNTDNKNTGQANIQDKSPYGNKVADTFAIGISGLYQIPQLFSCIDISLFSQIDRIERSYWYKDSQVIENHVDWQFSLGLTLSF